MNCLHLKVAAFAGILFSTITVSAQNFEWAAQIGGPLEDRLYKMLTTPSEEIYVLGSFRDTADFDITNSSHYLNGQGEKNLFITKYSSDNQLIWAKNIGNPGTLVSPTDIQQDLSGNTYISGYFYGEADFDPGNGINILSAPNEFDAFVAKVDPQGNFLWTKQIGSVGADHIYQLTVAPDGNIILTGDFMYTVDFDPGPAVYELTAADRDLFLLKLDPDGNFLWAKSAGSAGYDLGFDVTTDLSGNIYYSGSYEENTDFDLGSGTFYLPAESVHNGFISKISPDGNLIWAKKFVGNNESSILHLTFDPEGKLYAHGTFKDTIHIQVNSNELSFISENTPGGFLVKMTPDGEYEWFRKFAEASTMITSAIGFDTENNVYLGGTFYDTLTTGEDISECSAGEFSDAYLFKYTSSGELIWKYCFGGPSYDLCKSILIQPDNTILVGGTFVDYISFQGIDSAYTGAGNLDIFLAKFNPEALGLTENVTDGFSVFPNPTSGKVALHAIKAAGKVQLVLLDATGKEIESRIYSNISTLEYEIPGENGIYFLQLVSERENITVKIIKNQPINY